MIDNFSNSLEILKSQNSGRTSRLANEDASLLERNLYSLNISPARKLNAEVHIYTTDGKYLTGAHNNEYLVQQNQVQGGVTSYLNLNLIKIINELGIRRGIYKVITSLYDDLLGSFNGQKIWIKEISPSRRELRLALSDNYSPTLLSQYNNLKARWESDQVFDTFVLNMGFGDSHQIINFRFVDTDVPEIYVKLLNPLPTRIGEKFKLWISEEIIESVYDTVTVIPAVEEEELNYLPPANFDLEEYDGQSIATDYKSWNDLLSANLPTSQRVLDNYFSGSLSGIKLNINYKLFDNFVHFSSAEERVRNFLYKLQLIESYTDRIDYLYQVSGGFYSNSNLDDAYRKRNGIVSNFDDFEKYLFFESTGSAIYTHYDSSSGSIDPWPKTQPTNLLWSQAFMLWSQAAMLWTSSSLQSLAFDPYDYFRILARTDSATGEAYYEDLLEKAIIYDRSNIHRLKNAIPEYLQSVMGGEELVTFVDMLGQHYDILWTYIKALTNVNVREEHPKDGVSDELLFHIAQSMGFDLLNGRSTSELWKYSLGTNSSGTALQRGTRRSISDLDNVRETWRRIVNNLPYILKTKGTKRSIKALLSCFGIPSTILTIKEYGGPSTFTDLDHFPEYVHDVFHYAWLSTTGSLHLPLTTYPNGYGSNTFPHTLEFRFKTDNNFAYYTDTYYDICSVFSGSVGKIRLVLSKDSNDDNEGTLTLFQSGTFAISASNLEIFDNSWHNVAIEYLDNTASLKVAKSLYGKSIYVKSASAYGFPQPNYQVTLKFASASSLLGYTQPIAGGSANSLEKFFGHFQEIRLWSGSLNDATLKEHAASPGTYTFNVDRIGNNSGDPYYHLLQRWTLSTTEIKSGSFYQSSAHPRQWESGSLYFEGVDDSGSIKFEGFEETYYTPSPSLGGSSLYTNKVRIESASLNSNLRLNTKNRIERTSAERYSVDSNRVGVYFSPQTSINEDIFNQLGYFEIDDYIGDPRETYLTSYTSLNNFSKKYWKKYRGKNDFEAYFRALKIYDFTLFQYIKRLLPTRSNSIVGLVIEPNVLERSKVRTHKKPTVDNLTHNALIAREDFQEISGEYSSLEGVIQDSIINVEAEYQSNYGVIDTDMSNINKTGNAWMQHRYIGVYKITESGSYDPIQTVILSSRIHPTLLEEKTYTNSYFDTSTYPGVWVPQTTSSYFPADVNNFHGTGLDNLRFAGSRLTGPGVNVDTPNTVDGGPVVKVTKVNPNQIVFANNQITTADRTVTGIRNRSI